MKWQHFPQSSGVMAQTRKLPAICSEKEGRTPFKERERRMTGGEQEGVLPYEPLYMLSPEVATFDDIICPPCCKGFLGEN